MTQTIRKQSIAPVADIPFDEVDQAHAVEPKDWKIKNIDPKAIEAARKGAKKDGMMIGTWVAKVISEAAKGVAEERELTAQQQEEAVRRLTRELEEVKQSMSNFDAKLGDGLGDVHNALRVLTRAIAPIADNDRRVLG